MIENYVNKFIENLPEDSKKYKEIDLVLDGGAFNGSYLVGALYFLKEMEKRKFMKINRISGCSIGSIVAFLYYIDALHLMIDLYGEINKKFKNEYNLKFIKKLKVYLKKYVPNNICSKVNNKLFICYYDIKKQKKIVKSTYNDIDDIFETLTRSCYIPFLVDNKLIYKKKYIDGISAYIFKKEPNKKILYMELFSYDKFINAINIKNEKTNFHRKLTGLLDIHSFFIKNSNTSMCSFVDEWTTINQFNYKLKSLLETIIIYIIYFIVYIKKYLPKNIENNLIVKIISKILFDIFTITLETYCL
jgi:hypothetical protein